jgi:autotransporter-associated beta strand protein
MTLQPIRIEDAMNNPKTLNLSDEVDAPVECGKQSIHDRSLCFYKARLFFKLATPILRVGKCVGLLTVMLVAIPHQLTAQNMGDTLTWNGSSTAGSSWATSTVGSWYDKTTSGGVILSSPGSRDKTYNFLFEGASGTSKVAPSSMVVGGGNNFYAKSISFEQGFNSTNMTAITNGAAGATSITFGAGNGSTSVSANATAWTLANNATTGNVTFTNGTGALTLKLFTSGNVSVLNAGAITTIGSNITDFDATNNGGITKNGAGTLTLNGTNTYTGTTTVNNGTLALGSTGSIASSSVLKIASGATFDVKAKSGGFTLNNPLTIDVDLANAGKLDATGVALTYGGNLTLNITTATPLSSYNLFVFSSELGTFSSIALTGSFSGNMTNSSGVWTASSNGYDFTFTESNGVLSAATAAIPEPGTWVLVGIAAIFFLYRIRRKDASSSGHN